MRPPPKGWGLNSLTDALDSARLNQYATFDNKSASGDIVLIDRILFELLEGRVDPSPEFPMQFLLRAHSSFRAAAGCALAGQVYEATVLQRAVLEAAAYGLYIGNSAERGLMWLRREDSNTAKDKVRTAFGFGNLRRDIEERNPTLAPAFVSLYDTLVDFGAHPNEAGFSISTEIRANGTQKIIDTIYLHDDIGPALDFGLKNTARVGLWVVLAYRAIYPEFVMSNGSETSFSELIARH